MGLFSWIKNIANSVTGSAPSCPPPPPPVYKELCKVPTNRPDDLNDLNTNINKCASQTDQTINSNFATKTLAIQQDIDSLKSTITDSLVMGNTIFGPYGLDDIRLQLTATNKDLLIKKEKIRMEINKNEAMIERSDRDFSDVKDSITEDKPKKLHFIEDYTLAILCISYLFMLIALIYLYVAKPYMDIPPSFSILSLIQAIFGGVFLTLFMFILLYYLS